MKSAANHIELIFSEEGKLSHLPNYEFRPQQREMAEAVTSALEGRSHLILEAPTGVGKSLAYLVPAILHAVKEKRKAIVSTHTKNLQEQLYRKDIERTISALPVSATPSVNSGNCSIREKPENSCASRNGPR